MKKDFEKGKAAIWAKWGKKLGMPLPQEFRTQLEGNTGEGPGDEDITLNDLDGLIKEFFDKFELLEYFSSRKNPKDSASGKRYHRCFEKRLHLVEFVMERRLTIANWKRKSFALRKRINWKQICAEWNEAHPYDQMKPQLLKVRYYRAIAEGNIQREYFARKDYEEHSWWTGLFSELLKDISEGHAEGVISTMHQLPEGFGNQSFRKFESLKRFISQHRTELKAHALDLALDMFIDELLNMTGAEKEAKLKSLGLDNTEAGRELKATIIQLTKGGTP